MRHIQLYESFGQDHKVAAYTNFPEYREFKLTTVHETYLRMVEWLREEEFNKKIANGFPVYVVDNKLEFWENQDKPPVNWPESKSPIKAARLDKSGPMPLGRNALESSLGCSYKELIDQAKTPEEVMADEIEEDPTLIYYSSSRPLVYAKAAKILDSRGTMPSKETVEKFRKWKKIRDMI